MCRRHVGIGISADDQKKLFQKFFRADNSLTREAGGTGLGLVIVKTMVELLGGAIWLESEVGKGSKFYFTLPLYTEAEASSINEEEPAQAQQRATSPDRGLGMVLLIDDDAFARDSLQQTLHRRGYTVINVTEATDAGPKAKMHRPDVILLDMMLPDLGGFKVLRSLHLSPMTRGIPVVAYSLAGDPLHGPTALSAFSLLRKPFEGEGLAAALKQRVDGDRCPVALLVAWDAVPNDLEVAAITETLKSLGVCCVVATSSAQAITTVVTDQIDAVVIDIDRSNKATVFELMRAFKSEEEVARIPTVILTREIAKSGIHFHLGSDSIDATLALEYLVEQVSQVTRGAQ